MDGQGTYWFDTHTRYEGQFKDGMFHGAGILHFPNGGRYETNWKCGKEDGVGKYIFNDGLEFEENCDTLTGWRYGNRVWDRRFYKEIKEGLRPVNKCMLVTYCGPDGMPLRDIPSNCYDVGDGFYDPYYRIVYNYFEETEPGNITITSVSGDKPRTFIRNVTREEHDWIVTFCRSGNDDFVGCQKVTNYDDVAALSGIVGFVAKEKSGNFFKCKHINPKSEEGMQISATSSTYSVDKKVSFA
uniref:MORN repeat-containing protein 5 n=1 Tax=Ciona savignyi TaxID=51511 RepID=H2ZLP4_CIOSA